MDTPFNRPNKKKRTAIFMKCKKMKERRKSNKKDHRKGFRSIVAVENEVQEEYKLNSYELSNFLYFFVCSTMKWSIVEVMGDDGKVVKYGTTIEPSKQQMQEKTNEFYRTTKLLYV